LVMMSNHPRSARMLLVAAPLLWACGQPSAQVEVRTYVGDTFDRRDPALQREALSKVLRTLAPELWNRPQPSVPSEHPLSTPTPHPPRTPGEFEALVEALRRSPIDELSGPAQRLTQAPASLWPEIRAALFEERRAPKGDYRTVLAVIGGDVP